MELFKKTLKTLFLFLHLVIFAGVSLQGYFVFTNGFFFSDKIFGGSFVLLGIIFSIVVLKTIWKTLKSEKVVLYPWKNNKKPLIISGVALVLLIVGKKAMIIQFLYAGLIVGEFAITQARNAYLRISDLDLHDFNFDKLAWLGQFYLLYTIVQWIYVKVTKKKLDTNAAPR